MSPIPPDNMDSSRVVWSPAVRALEHLTVVAGTVSLQTDCAAERQPRRFAPHYHDETLGRWVIASDRLSEGTELNRPINQEPSEVVQRASPTDRWLSVQHRQPLVTVLSDGRVDHPGALRQPVEPGAGTFRLPTRSGPAAGSGSGP
jgi:hypothetical protein